MKLSERSVNSIMLFFILASQIGFAQDLKGNRVVSTYLKKVKAEGCELVVHGSFNSGELPKSIKLDLEEYYKYQIYAIPTGKLKAVRMEIGYMNVPGSTKQNPVLDWVYVARSSKKTVFKFLNTKKKGSFKLSPENSLYYIIAKKPV
ncbi:MAG: hypothetical protein ACPG21_06810 [Crocinitomicaceae bacterium]